MKTKKSKQCPVCLHGGFPAERDGFHGQYESGYLHNQYTQLSTLWGDLTGSIKSRVSQACVMTGRRVRKQIHLMGNYRGAVLPLPK